MDLLLVPNIVWILTNAKINRVIRALNALIFMDLSVARVLKALRAIL